VLGLRPREVHPQEIGQDVPVGLGSAVGQRVAFGDGLASATWGARCTASSASACWAWRPSPPAPWWPNRESADPPAGSRGARGRREQGGKAGGPRSRSQSPRRSNERNGIVYAVPGTKPSTKAPPATAGVSCWGRPPAPTAASWPGERSRTTRRWSESRER